MASSSLHLQNQIVFVLGQAYEAAGTAQGAEQYRAAAAIAPMDPGLRIKMALLALAGGDDRGYDQAAAELRRGLIDMPNEPDLLLRLLDVELRRQLRLAPDRRSWRDFEQTAARAAAVAPNSPDLVGSQAEYLAATGKLDQAVTQVKGAVKQDLKDPELWRIWAVGLGRQGKLDEAERVLERAMATENAGDHAALRIELARVLTLLGRGREVRDKLIDRWQSLPPYQRPAIWKAAYEFARGRGQADEVRRALVQWAALEPKNPQPALSLLETALADDDREALKSATGMIAKIPTYQGVYSAIARLQEILRDPLLGAASTDKKARDKRFADAEKLVAEIQDKAPALWVGYAQEGRLRELQNQPEAALKAYRKARELGGTGSVVPRMVLLLTRLKRLDELANLRNDFAGNISIDRLAAETSLNLGERDQAEGLAAQVVSGDPDGLDARQWQSRVLNTLGESDKAEATLRDFVARHPGEPAPLLALLQFQIGLQRPADTIDATLKQIDVEVRVDRPEFVRAQSRRIAGDLKGAEPLYRAALKKWPNDPAVALGAASFFFENLNRDDEAEKILRDRLQRDPADSAAARGLALVLASRVDEPKAWGEAWNLIKPGAPGSGNTPNDRYVRAQILQGEPGRCAEAIAELETLLADLPLDRAESVNGRDLLSRLYCAAGETDKALELLRVAANAPGRTDSEAIVRYLLALIDAKKTAEAAKQLDRLAELQPKFLRTDLLRANFSRPKAKSDEAVAVLKLTYESRADSPNGEFAGRQVIVALDKLKRFDDAETVARDLTKRNPALAWLIADTEILRGNPDKTLASCQAALEAEATSGATDVALKLAMKAADASPADSATLRRAVAFIESAQAKSGDDPQLLICLANATTSKAVTTTRSGSTDSPSTKNRRITCSSTNSPISSPRNRTNLPRRFNGSMNASFTSAGSPISSTPRASS